MINTIAHSSSFIHSHDAPVVIAVAALAAFAVYRLVIVRKK